MFSLTLIAEYKMNSSDNLATFNWLKIFVRRHKKNYPNTNYKVPNTNISIKLKLIVGFIRVKCMLSRGRVILT